MRLINSRENSGLPSPGTLSDVAPSGAHAREPEAQATPLIGVDGPMSEVKTTAAAPKIANRRCFMFLQLSMDQIFCL